MCHRGRGGPKERYNHSVKPAVKHLPESWPRVHVPTWGGTIIMWHCLGDTTVRGETVANGETGTRVTPGTGHLSRVTCHVWCDDYYVTSPSAEAGTLSRYSPHTAAERMPGPVRQVVTYIETTANGEHIGPMVPGCGNHRSRVTTPAPWTLQLPQLLLVHIYTDTDMVQCPSSSTLSWICLLFILSPQDSIYSSVSHIVFIRNFWQVIIKD